MDRDEYLNSLAVKYNWFTAKKDIENISDYIKISYVYCYGDIFEIYYIFRLFEYDVLQKAYEYVENDWYALKEKRKDTLIYYLNRKRKSDDMKLDP